MSLTVLSLEYQKQTNMLDYRVGNILLAKHLDTSLRSALDFPTYVEQMLCQAPSGFPSGRVPLFVCQECADIGCGAITVAIEQTATHFIWRDFGHEAPYNTTHSQSDYMMRTGPFSFEKTKYINALSGQLSNGLSRR